MTTKKGLKSFLQIIARPPKEIRHVVDLPAVLLKKGTWFQGQASSAEYAVAKKWKKKEKPQAKDCFYNAQVFSSETNGIRYFEGYVLLQEAGTPVKHAWVVMQDGRVVDFTLEAMEVLAAEFGKRFDLKKVWYVGVEVPPLFIREHMDETDWYEPVAELYLESEIFE